jgi:hypothetical protein
MQRMRKTYDAAFKATVLEARAHLGAFRFY